MQLLIVHSDASLGAQLLQMVKEFTGHTAELLSGNEAALAWARQAESCDFLLAELDGPGLDGLSLGGALSEFFPRLQTAFLPAYPAAEERLEVRERKVFPEPIDGAGLLEALRRAEASGGSGPDLFHVVDVLQMCCLSGRNGAVQLVRGEEAGMVFLEEGQITEAEAPGRRTGAEALFELVGWEMVEFAYDHSVTPPSRSITEKWDKVLIDAVLRHKQQKLGAPAAEEWSGRRLGPYEVGERLGEESWGRIYAATQAGVDRTVALVILRDELRRDAARVAEFMAEARARANVQHPRIISVYEAGEHEGTVFCARELITGETLAERQARNLKMTEAIAFEMINAVAEAAAYLQQRRIARLPITAEGIVLAADGTTRLVNPAVADSEQLVANEQSEIQTLGRLLTPMMTRTVPGPGIIPRLINRMQTIGAAGFTTWQALAEETGKIDRRALTATAGAR